MTGDEIRGYKCPCCSVTVNISESNMRRIVNAVNHRFGERPVSFDISEMPEGIDLTGPVTAAEIARVVTACCVPDRRC